MDLQERPAARRRGCGELGHRRALHDGRAAAAGCWGTACRRTSRPARAASIPTGTRSSAHINAVAKAAVAAGPAGDQRRHQEEGAGRRLQERRARVAAQGRARAGARARLQGQAARQGDPLRGLRHRRRPGVGQRRDRPRHRPVRGQLDPQLVEAPRPAALPERHAAADHRRLRRLQRQPHAAVEGRAAKAGRRDRARDRASATSRPAPRSGTGSSTACSASSR